MKRTRIRRKSPARKIKQQADLILRERVFERDGRRCVRCGSTRRLCGSHVLPKGKYPRLRWLEINLLTMCFGCHIPFWHKDPIAAAEWFAKTYPERLRVLQTLKDTAPKVNLKELLAELQREESRPV